MSQHGIPLAATEHPSPHSRGSHPHVSCPETAPIGGTTFPRAACARAEEQVGRVGHCVPIGWPGAVRAAIGWAAVTRGGGRQADSRGPVRERAGSGAGTGSGRRARAAGVGSGPARPRHAGRPGGVAGPPPLRLPAAGRAAAGARGAGGAAAGGRGQSAGVCARRWAGVCRQWAGNAPSERREGDVGVLQSVSLSSQISSAVVPSLPGVLGSLLSRPAEFWGRSAHAEERCQCGGLC